MSLDYTVISIGTLSRNRLWGEGAAVRTSHATTVLVVSGERVILVDPSLPSPAMDARFAERTGKDISCVTDVFLTTLRPVHRRSLTSLRNAKWWASQTEKKWYAEHFAELEELARRGGDVPDEEQRLMLAREHECLKRIQAAPDQFGPQVHLFPLPGATPGCTGLLLTPATASVVIAGDAVVTGEHYLRGQIWDGSMDVESAKESLSSIVELADIVIPGHDNLLAAGATSAMQGI